MKSGFRAGKFDVSQVSGPLRNLCPSVSVFSIQDIDPEELYRSGKRLVLLDVDNTLLPWKSESLPPASVAWIESIKRAKLEICILSNTRHQARLDRIAKKLGVPYLRGKFKPNPAMYRQAMESYSVRPDQTIMIGDQLFTDVLGANRCGIEAIWVRRMSRKEFIGTKFSRIGERIVRRQLYSAMPETPESKEFEPVPAQTEGERDLPAGGISALTLMRVPVVRQFIKFAIVGGSSTIIDKGLLFLLMFFVPWGGQPLGTALGVWLSTNIPTVFGNPIRPSDPAVPVLTAVSASIAILNSFYWNRRWTFKIRGKAERLAQLRRFVVVSVTGLFLNTVITTSLNAVVPGHQKISLAVASAVAIVAVAFWNFTGQKLWAFRDKGAD